MSQLSEEINEKIPKKTQKLLIYLISVVILIVAGLFVFRPLYTKAMTNVDEADKLQSTLSEYKKLDAAKETNKKSIEQYENNIKVMLAKYPFDVYPEDMIVILSELETQTGIDFTDISIENNNYVNDNSSSSSSSGNSALSTAAASTNTTSADSLNNSTNSSSNSSSSSSSSSSNSSNSSATASGGSTAVVTSEKYSLYSTPVTCAFEVSYVGVKQLFTALLSSPLKKNVESVDLSYDESTGELLGTMVIDFYTLKYTDNTVDGHEPMPDVSRGTANIFHSIR